MKSLYRHLNAKHFLLLSFVICALGDLAFGGALYLRYGNYQYFVEQFQLTMKIMQQGDVPLTNLPPNFVEELFQVIRRTLITVLAVAYAIHAFVYWAYLKKKRWAIVYVKMLCWFGPVLCLLFAWGNLGFHWSYGYFYFQLLAYLWAAIGYRYFDLSLKTAE